MHRAYAVLVVKGIDPATRTITGIASTPTPDRHGDILEPLGATFANPVPLLLHHDLARPVGTASLTATAQGITFVATLPIIKAAGPLKDRVDEAWQSVEAGIIRGASIGFRALADGLKRLKDGGVHFLKTEVCELSLVTIPANLEATILSVKSLDAPHLAASGPDPAGVSALPTVRAEKAAPRMATQTTAEQITNFEHTRAAKAGRMAALMEQAAEKGETLDETQTEEYDGLEREVKSVDAHLVRLRALEKTQIAAAVAAPASPVTPPTGNGRPVITVKSQLPLGTVFTRIAIAKAVGHGNNWEAIEYAKRWDDSTPEVGLYLKAAVAPGNTTDVAWAGPLAQYQNIANEFIELLRPATIIGRVPNMRRVPFLSSVPIQTAGGSYGWVGQAKAKPVTKLAFGTTKLDISKAAGIIVLTEELVRTSTPSAEAVVRADMIAGIAAFLDQQFIDPAVAAVPDTNPASITNGITPIAATVPTNPLADVQKLLAALAQGNMPLGGVVLIMSETNALALGFARDAQGNRLFPNVGVSGGTIEGITVVTSNAAGTNIIALQPSYILYADEGGVSIDVSREASVQMDSAPANPPDATTVLVSLWQNNLVGLRAERWINWKRGLDAAVKFVNGANYTPAMTGETPETPPARNGRDRER